MEKKNINIGVVRICTILLLTVFTIGRKYGEEQKNATALITDLKQQPCACCLNFDNVSEVAKEIDDEKTELKTAKTSLEKENGKLLSEKNHLLVDKNQLEIDKNQLQNEKEILVVEKNKVSNLFGEQNNKLAKLNKDFDSLKVNYTKINNENKKNKEILGNCQQNFKRVYKERNDLKEILKNTKTNVNTEEYVKFYNSISAEKKAKIYSLLHGDALEEKIYTFYIPFKFKDCGDCFKREKMPGLFNHNVGFYDTNISLQDILKSIFIRYGMEQINKEKIIDVKILKEIYFYVKFLYGKDEMSNKDIVNIILNKEGKPVSKAEKLKDDIIVPVNCFYPTSEEYVNKKNKKQNIFSNYSYIAAGVCYKNFKDKILLNYSDLIELVEIDEYWRRKENFDDDNALFLLELDFKDPECIALLESVGKGNYGVVKKGLTFENGKLVTKAIKFTCSNNLFQNSSDENILKEIRAGKIVNEIGVGNKIAFVQDYMKIKNFKKRYDYKKEEEKKIEIVPLKEETEDGNLTNAVYTTFLNDNLETLPKEKKNVSEDFKNNVFSKNGKIGDNLYIMFLDLVNGNDLFLNEEKEKIDINSLGKMLFDVLNSLGVNGVALKDIKPKNIMWDKQNKEFSIIDVQTLEKVGRDLTDSCGTPELWPFFKTLNLDLNSKNEIIDKDKKDNLYDRFRYSIDDNFVDIYAACMTMYFAKFSTYTAAGLLTLLLKWIILDKEKKTNIEEKIMFLKNYAKNYTSYITNTKNKGKIEDLDADKKLIKSFFEEIDDKNLNDDQKNNLANLLKQVITTKNESNIFYLLNEINENIVNKYENNDSLKDDFENIINFYKERVKNDFVNFAKLSNENCNYADVIKYVLCYGSCLNYNGGKEEMKVDGILGQLKLKDKIESEDKEFFDINSNKPIEDVIEKLNNGFNQKFIIDLLKILPLNEYDDILKLGVSRNSVDYYFDKKKKLLKNKINDNDIEKQKNVFYLLRYLEINKLFHIPKNLLKINSLINENKVDEFE